ncbi:hydroxymethylbilane synthase [Desulfobotulus sp. H1]|uniref:Porphobilinogen deaminase n=1 Tax=Desulfobotulus pelophilus TaxID=2823377 RepID=A0ABT3NC53_9BACT|nr:hydroxymethylbilane synthase [Desulfobotulus pelophilus]MCW7755050.1 hydroxymethylbilane synthase [Desulfobotulus pelophilus]
MYPIRIGTRKSELALWQARHVADLLHKAGMETELIPLETKGDKILDVSIAKIGSKGVFTEEIEADLASGKMDIAVHSAKDMQSILPEGFELIAFTEREYPGDVLVSRRKTARLNDREKPLTVGTSSVRRVALLRHAFPHVKVVDMRGNLQTRIRKMDEGQCDALILAFAGVHRMGYDDLIAEKLPLSLFIPPVGQGCIAIEAFTHLDPARKEKIRAAVNHNPTETRLLAERAFLRRLEGGCSIPAFAFADLNQNRLRLSAGIIDPMGQKLITREVEGYGRDAENMGHNLAGEILSAGGAAILDAIQQERRNG